MLVADLERQVEGDLEARLVEAREDLSRVDRLELREGVASLVGRHEVETFEGLVEGRFVVDLDPRSARVEAGRGAKPNDPGLAHLTVFEAASRSVGSELLDALGSQTLAVEEDLGARVVDLEVDGDPARERVAIRVDAQGEVVAQGTHALRQTALRCLGRLAGEGLGASVGIHRVGEDQADDDQQADEHETQGSHGLSGVR